MNLTVSVIRELFPGEKLCFTEFAPTKTIIMFRFPVLAAQEKQKVSEEDIKQMDSKKDGPTTRRRSARQSPKKGLTF